MHGAESGQTNLIDSFFPHYFRIQKNQDFRKRFHESAEKKYGKVNISINS